MLTYSADFFVLHKSGKIYFSRNFQGDALDPSLVVGFSSSVSNFCKTLLGEDIREVVSQKGKIIYKEFGDFIMVVHSELQSSTVPVQALLRDVGAMCEFLFGSHDYWDDDLFDLKGAQVQKSPLYEPQSDVPCQNSKDIVSMYFLKVANDPGMVCGGLTQIFLESDIQERLDKLVAFIESQEGVCGNGTLLLLGDSVLYSRFGMQETRMILQYAKARPLGACTVRYSPVYVNSAWQNLYMIRMQSYVLVVLAFIDKPYEQLARKVEEFREPPILLRLFAKRETLAMLYHNIKTGSTIFPQLRPGPDVQQREIMSSFWGFFCDAVMASESVSSDGVNAVAAETLKNLRTFSL
ncbi:hypothetical protein HK101_002347 [Irineochytrium annulatum]|nr:hypothetical protein HK101_002347 [Irineochytrium annulatum]